MENKSQKNGANGATLPVNGKEVKLETKPTTITAVKIESPTTTLESQKQKAELLCDLFERQEKLAASRSTLKSFTIASDEDNNSLELRDTKGKSFKTGNPVVIGQVIKLIEKTLEEKLTETQVKILSI